MPDSVSTSFAPALAVRGLSYGFGGHEVFRGLSFSQEPGEHSLLLGPSGSGKTTLINLIAGLLVPQTGEIEVAGEPMSRLPPTGRDDLRRRRIGAIFQNLYLISALTVRGNLRLAQKLVTGAVDDGAIDALLEAVGLAHRDSAMPQTLSQGEAQRAAIARALVGRPALVVADEPTSALDDVNADRVARLLIDSAAGSGSTLLIATHDARLKAFVSKALTLPPRP